MKLTEHVGFSTQTRQNVISMVNELWCTQYGLTRTVKNYCCTAVETMTVHLF